MGGCKITQVAFVCLFPDVCFQMSPQIACLRGCITTQVAFVGLFSTVHFQMIPQIPWQMGCIITEIAFVFLFSTMGFQMFPQIACFIGCIITQVAFVCLFLVFNMLLFRILCQTLCTQTLEHPSGDFLHTFLVAYDNKHNGNWVRHAKCTWSSSSFKV